MGPRLAWRGVWQVLRSPGCDISQKRRRAMQQPQKKHKNEAQEKNKLNASRAPLAYIQKIQQTLQVLMSDIQQESSPPNWRSPYGIGPCELPSN